MSNVHGKLTFRLLDELHCISCYAIPFDYETFPGFRSLFSRDQKPTRSARIFFYCFNYFSSNKDASGVTEWQYAAVPRYAIAHIDQINKTFHEEMLCIN